MMEFGPKNTGFADKARNLKIFNYSRGRTNSANICWTNHMSVSIAERNVPTV